MRFIEYMPFDGNKWSMNKFVPYRSMLAQIMERWPQLSRRQDSPNDTSKVGVVPILVTQDVPVLLGISSPWV